MWNVKNCPGPHWRSRTILTLFQIFLRPEHFVTTACCTTPCPTLARSWLIIRRCVILPPGTKIGFSFWRLQWRWIPAQKASNDMQRPSAHRGPTMGRIDVVGAREGWARPGCGTGNFFLPSPVISIGKKMGYLLFFTYFFHPLQYSTHADAATNSCTRLLGGRPLFLDCADGKLRNQSSKGIQAIAGVPQANRCKQIGSNGTGLENANYSTTAMDIKT